MRIPKMIIFDYGQTLVDERSFNPLKGTEEVLKMSSHNPNAVTAVEIQSLANQLHQELGRVEANSKEAMQFEIHNHSFQRFLYEYYGVQLTKSALEVERIFVNAAFEIRPTNNLENLLKSLEYRGIRTAAH